MKLLLCNNHLITVHFLKRNSIMKKFNLKSFLFLAFAAVMTFGFVSCGDDEPEEVMGCTNPNSDQYNENATVDDGSCSTYFDRFLGTWEGTFNCPGALADLFVSADLAVSSTSGTDMVSAFVISSRLPDPVPVNGTITENTLTITQALSDVPLDLLPDPIVGETFDINVDGVLTLNDDGSEMTGTITISLEEKTFGAGTLADVCTYTATKQ